jgi:hypothetical protein
MLVTVLERTNETNRFTGRKIIEWFTGQGFPVSQIRLCKMINYLRVKNLLTPKVIIGAGNGYFLTSDPHIIEDQIESLKGRIDSMKAVVDSLNAEVLSIKKAGIKIPA